MGLSPVDVFKAYEFENAKGIVAAVSGGSDSLALLFLLNDFLATLDNPPNLTAVTIDHRLRTESAREATDVGLLCRAHGIAHRILNWDDVKPTNGVAAAARSARYRLLVQAAKEAGADFIATGHTCDDQIETFLMRRERSSHAEARGLAAMATRSLLEGSVELIRPLLNHSRAELRSDLVARGIDWIDDPSNANTQYERPRVRLSTAAEADPALILAQIDLARAARKRDNAALTAAMADPDCVRMDALGVIYVDAAIYAALPDNVRVLFSGVLASIAGGRRFLPGDSERSRIERVLSGHEKNSRLTVFGTLIERGEEGLPHMFRRERRNLPKMKLAPYESIIWDGRYRLSNETSEEWDVAAPGRQALTDFLASRKIDVSPQQRDALMVLPALLRGDDIAQLLFLDTGQNGVRIPCEKHFALFDHVLPGYDFGLAKAFEKQFGRECPNFYKPD